MTVPSCGEFDCMSTCLNGLSAKTLAFPQSPENMHVDLISSLKFLMECDCWVFCQCVPLVNRSGCTLPLAWWKLEPCCDPEQQEITIMCNFSHTHKDSRLCMIAGICLTFFLKDFFLIILEQSPQLSVRPKQIL